MADPSGVPQGMRTAAWLSGQGAAIVGGPSGAGRFANRHLVRCLRARLKHRSTAPWQHCFQSNKHLGGWKAELGVDTGYLLVRKDSSAREVCRPQVPDPTGVRVAGIGRLRAWGGWRGREREGGEAIGHRARAEDKLEGVISHTWTLSSLELTSPRANSSKTTTLTTRRMLLLPLLSASLVLPAASALQLPFLSPPLPTNNPPTHYSHPTSPSAPSFTLQHAIHLSTTHRHAPALHLSYTPTLLSTLSADSGHAQTQSLQLTPRIGQRPNDQIYFQAARRASFFSAERAAKLGRFWTAGEMREMELGSGLEWDEVEVEVPDVSDSGTVGNLAKMSANAYRTPDHPENWYNLSQGWNHVSQ